MGKKILVVLCGVGEKGKHVDDWQLTNCDWVVLGLLFLFCSTWLFLSFDESSKLRDGLLTKEVSKTISCSLILFSCFVIGLGPSPNKMALLKIKFFCNFFLLGIWKTVLDILFLCFCYYACDDSLSLLSSGLQLFTVGQVVGWQLTS